VRGTIFLEDLEEPRGNPLGLIDKEQRERAQRRIAPTATLVAGRIEASSAAGKGEL